MGTPSKDVAKYEKVVATFGNVAPAIVAADGGMYRLLDGHARVEACTRAGVKDIPVVVAQTSDAEEQTKLSLLLSAARENGSPISEGALIEKLIKEHGQTLLELSKLVGRSKAWLSRRQAMARNLSPSLGDMVLSGAVCARSAQEIARLPHDEQALFAANVVRDELCKDDVCELVRMYRSPHATLELCRTIIASPSDALSSCPRGGKSRKMRSKNTPESRIASASHYAMNLLEEIGKMVIECDDAVVTSTQGHLMDLCGKMQVVTKLIIVRVDTIVALGQQGGGQHD